MTGVNQGWYRLASHLKMSVQRAKAEIPAREFWSWLFYLDDLEKQKFTGQDKWEVYAARLIAEVRRSWVKNADKVKEDDFFVKYMVKEKPNQITKTKDQRIAEAHHYWDSLFKPMLRKKKKG